MNRQTMKSLAAKSLSLDKRMAGYGAMSIAIAAAVAPNAHAGQTFWTPDVTTPAGGGIYFDVFTGEATTVSSNSSLAPGGSPGRFALENETGPGLLKKAWIVASSNNEFAIARADNNSASLHPYPASAARLALNTPVGTGLTFNNPKRIFNPVTSSSYPNNVFDSLASNRPASIAQGHWNALGTGYLGLTFDVGAQVYYGWAQITVNADYTVTLDSMYYNDTGVSVKAGDIAETPEPDSLLLMALGAAGLAAYRRRQAAKSLPSVRQAD